MADLTPHRVAVPTDTGKPDQIRQFCVQVVKAINRMVGLSPGGYIRIDATTKIAFQSPNGHWWRLEFDNTGLPNTTDLGTTPP